MANQEPFVLLDDARVEAAADAHYYVRPQEIFVAHRAADVADALARADAAQTESGGTLAGYIAYEAGLALEPRLTPLAEQRSGADGPLVWLGLFADEEVIPAADMPDWLEHRAEGEASLGPLEPQISPGAYVEAFEALQDAIHAGDIYQANLTFPLAGSFRGDPLTLYAQLRGAASAGYGGVIFDGSHYLLSLSPELFVSLKGGGVKAKPMKGTRPRGGDPAQDAALAQELASSVKDKAENLMIVDLMRNDLSRVAAAGSVRVDAPFAVESYPTVHQMVTTVRAKLLDGVGPAELVRAIFPCGSITGAPKIRAMELINQHERDPRGVYCGAIGRIGADGDAALNVAIRTLRLTEIENGQGHAVLGVGSAITADSAPMDEWRESIIKGSFTRAMGASGTGPKNRAPQCDLIESMRFDPASGIDLLELHLERMKASASELGFAFDRHAARNQIQSLCFDLERVSKVRLLLARSGAIALESSDLPEATSTASHSVMRCIILPLPVDEGDWRLRHKTSDRGFYEEARAAALDAGADEALFIRGDGLVTEGCITNIFLERGDALLTPDASLGLLPGVLRRSLIDEGKAREARLTLDDLEAADLQGTLHFGNAVRGLIRAELLK